MKQLLVIAIALASTNAFASRARVQSLGNSAHITDTQSVYSNPAKMFLMGDFVNLESGAQTTTTQNANAEGLLVRSMGDAKAGLSLGHKSENASAFGLRALLVGGAGAPLATMNVLVEQQNPLELSYGMKSGDMTWAGTFVYSNYNDKVTDAKENSMGVRLGALTGAWDFSLGLGLLNTVKGKSAVTIAPAGVTTGDEIEFKGTIGVSAFAGYTMGSLYTFGEVVLAGAKMENTTTATEMAKVDSTQITIGAVESVKKDGNEFFYGVSLVSSDLKNKTADEKTTSLSLPVIVGLEAEATSWMVLRGSLTQTVLINNSKETDTTGTTAETSPGLNNTVAAIGAGLKFNKVTVDGSLQGLTGTAANQQLDGNDLLTTVGLTYVF